MGGWFRKEIKTVADLQGLKMRIAGIAGQVMQKLGVVPQQIAGGDIYPALERGTIDAAEWVGPYDDEKLGFHKVAPYYYYPGFWEGGPTVHLYFIKPKVGRAAEDLQGDARERRRLRQHGDARRSTTPRTRRRCAGWSAPARSCGRSRQDVMEAAYKARTRSMTRSRPRTPTSRRCTTSLRAFRNEEYLWCQVAEYTFDNFMIRARARG